MKVKELIDFLKTLPQDMTVVMEKSDDCYVWYDELTGTSEAINGVKRDASYDRFEEYNQWTQEKYKNKIERVICIS